MTRAPRCSDSATFSAAWRHTLQARKSGSPSFHSPDARSRVRGVEATRNFATAAPEGVKRSSGSSVRFPTTVMVVSPAIDSSSRTSRLIWAEACQLGVTVSARSGSDVPEWVLADFRTDDLGAQHRLVESELPVQLGYRLRVRLQVDDSVD